MTQAMQILFERNVMTQQMVNNLGLQLNVLYQEHNHLKEMLGGFVQKLNEKIVSNDNFHLLLKEIELKMYRKDKPVIAICKIVTQLDARTVKDSRKMKILQQSLVQEGILSENPIPLQELFMDLLTCTPEEAGQFILGFGAIRQHYLPSLFLEFLETYYYMSDMERKLKSKEKFCAHYLDVNQIDENLTLQSDEVYDSFANSLDTAYVKAELISNLATISEQLTEFADLLEQSKETSKMAQEVCDMLDEFNAEFGDSEDYDEDDFEIEDGCLIEYTGCEDNVHIPDFVTVIGDNAFRYCSIESVEIPDSVIEIGAFAFAECGLISVEIPDSVERIGVCAFSECSSLVLVEIGDAVETIGDGVFSDCSSLEAVVIGDSVEEIGQESFSNCTTLISVVIGDSVTEIGQDAFSDCSSLTNLVLGDALETISDFAFKNCISLTSVEIGDSLEKIGDSAFENCTSLNSVEIGETVDSIGDSAFEDCTSLNSLAIGEAVDTIGKRSFYNCTSLTSVVIPESVATIGDSAFDNCTSLSKVIFEGNPNDIDIGSWAFDETPWGAKNRY